MISQMDNMNYKGRHPRIRIMLDIDKRNQVCLAVCVGCQRLCWLAYDRTAMLLGNLAFSRAPDWYAVMNFSASFLSSHCNRQPILARRVRPPRMYSTTSTGRSTTIINKFSGTLAKLFSVCNDMATRSLAANLKRKKSMVKWWTQLHITPLTDLAS